MNQIEFYYTMKNIENIIGYIIVFVVLVFPIICIIIAKIFYEIKEKFKKRGNKDE